jgi:hypothetical protein
MIIAASCLHLSRRPFSSIQIFREEEELDEEEKAKREKIAKLQKPDILPGMVPRRRRGLTVETFLEKIGKGCAEHKDKFSSWEDLFTFKSRTLRLKEIPTKQRKWILKWVERYRQGDTPGIDK